MTPAPDEQVIIAPTRVHRLLDGCDPEFPFPACGRWIGGDEGSGRRTRETHTFASAGLPPCQRCWPVKTVRVPVDEFPTPERLRQLATRVSELGDKPWIEDIARVLTGMAGILERGEM